ncbi:Spherulation-specific family 4-domain-containing protein [Phialemonium atrogriseum]|uniref:Spherulation-specific family 4-domain-containing protein n=1 Tax=Phialemonium atrogriseum TaxID=1093897 RepID=A0AAJ0BVC0_9PEZI|nr:Spherulation-specific family 4-domain-containing protein [Phialemonium atrogriseum]KAK1764980.1 Spherulation-specific family 4-domain-containing protein [Phialemonium atrogriseum]
MKFTAALLGFASTTWSTGILLPLYIYPSDTFKDGAARWKPAFDAIEANPGVQWRVVINPANGPGPTFQPGNNDENYIDGTAKFNTYPSVETIGYVRTDYGQSPVSEVKANITAWANWATYATADISVKGIFFDEAGASDGSNLAYLSDVISFARLAFTTPIAAICNFGARPADEYYSVCDVAIVFESCLDHGSGPEACLTAAEYGNQMTISANIPDAAHRSAAAIIVHDFAGTAADGQAADEATLESYIHTLKANGVGWGYFTTQGYEDGITAPPASIANVARFMASA